MGNSCCVTNDSFVGSDVSSFTSDDTSVFPPATGTRRRSPESSRGGGGAHTAVPGDHPLRSGGGVVPSGSSGFTLTGFGGCVTPASSMGGGAVMDSSAATVREQDADPLSQNPLAGNPLDPMYSSHPNVLRSMDVATAPPRPRIRRHSNDAPSDNYQSRLVGNMDEDDALESGGLLLGMVSSQPPPPSARNITEEEDVAGLRKLALQQLRGVAPDKHRKQHGGEGPQSSAGGGPSDGEHHDDQHSPSPCETGSMDRSADEFSLVSAASSVQFNDSRRKGSLPGGGASNSGIFGGMTSQQIISAQGKLRKASGVPNMGLAADAMVSEEDAMDLVSRTSSTCQAAVLLDKSFDASNMVGIGLGQLNGGAELPDVASPVNTTLDDRHSSQRRNSFDQYIHDHVAGAHAARRTFWFRCDLARDALQRRKTVPTADCVVYVAPRHASKVRIARFVQVDAPHDGSIGSRQTAHETYHSEHPIPVHVISSGSNGDGSISGAVGAVTQQSRNTTTAGSGTRRSDTPLSVLTEATVPHSQQLAKKTRTADIGNLEIVLFGRP